MRTSIFIAIAAAIFTIGCSREPSLQKYMVERTEDSDFIALDVSPSILNVQKQSLSAEQKDALDAFEKMNIIAFKLDDNNRSKFEAERTKVSDILKDEKYQQLMKFGKGKEVATVSFVGDEEHIDEFVFFGNKNDIGFTVVRIIGNDMNPNDIMNLMTVMQKSDVDMDQLKPLQQMFGK